MIHLITSHSAELKLKMPGRTDILFQHVVPTVSEVPASKTTECPEVRYCLVTLKAKSGWKIAMFTHALPVFKQAGGIWYREVLFEGSLRTWLTEILACTRAVISKRLKDDNEIIS